MTSSRWDKYNTAVVELYKLEEKLKKAKETYNEWYSLAADCMSISELDKTMKKKTNPSWIKVTDKLQDEITVAKRAIKDIKTGLERKIRFELDDNEEDWDIYLKVDQLKNG